MKIVELITTSNYESLSANKWFIISLNENDSFIVVARFAHPSEIRAISSILEYEFFFLGHFSQNFVGIVFLDIITFVKLPIEVIHMGNIDWTNSTWLRNIHSIKKIESSRVGGYEDVEELADLEELAAALDQLLRRVRRVHLVWTLRVNYTHTN